MTNNSDQSPVRKVEAMVERHARALGLVCMAWSTLEGEVDHFLGGLIPLPHGDTEKTVTSNMDFRKKLSVIVQLAFLHKHSDQTFSDLQDLVNLIDNNLRPERNRYVHDTYELDLHGEEARMTKVTKASKLLKPQAFQFKLVTETKATVKIEELESLPTRISAAAFELRAIKDEYEAASDPNRTDDET